MPLNSGLYGGSSNTNKRTANSPLGAALYNSISGVTPSGPVPTVLPTAVQNPRMGGEQPTEQDYWDKWIEEQYKAQSGDLIRKNQELANAAGIASSGVAVDTTTRALQDLRSSLTGTATTGRQTEQLQKQQLEQQAANLATQLGSDKALQEATIANQQKLQNEALANQKALQEQTLAKQAEQNELNRLLEAQQAEESRKSNEKIAEESSPNALSSIASALGGGATMYGISQMGKGANSAASSLPAPFPGTNWVDSGKGTMQAAAYNPATNSTSFATGPGTSYPISASSTPKPGMSSLQKGGLGALSTLAGAGVGSLIGGNQNKAWSGGGLAGSAMGGLGGYFAGAPIAGAMGVANAGLGSSLVGAGLGGLFGNILGRQLLRF